MGGYMLNFLEYLDEVGDIFKATVGADFLNTLTILEPKASVGNPDTVKVVQIGDTGERFEAAAEIELAITHHSCNLIQRNLVHVVLLGPVN